MTISVRNQSVQRTFRRRAPRTWPCKIQGLSRRRHSAPARPAATGEALPMKPIITTALALVMPPPPRRPPPRYGSLARSWSRAQQPQQVPRRRAALRRRSIKPSKKALKALIDLQTAVKRRTPRTSRPRSPRPKLSPRPRKTDTCIAQLQLGRRSRRTTMPAIAAAIDAIVASGYNRCCQGKQAVVALGGDLYNNKQYAAGGGGLPEGARHQSARRATRGPLARRGSVGRAESRGGQPPSSARSRQHSRREETRRESVQARGWRRL